MYAACVRELIIMADRQTPLVSPIKHPTDQGRRRRDERTRPADHRQPAATVSDPIELRDIRDETGEKHRRGEDVSASNLSNPTLAEEQEEEAETAPAQDPQIGRRNVDPAGAAASTAGARAGLDRG